jgi:hypothetical protein
MIQISLTTALVFYSAVLGCLILFIWIYTEISGRRSHLVLEKQFLWHCVFCGYIYLDETAETLSQCPRCHSYSSTDDKLARYIDTRPTRATFVEEIGGLEEGRNTSRRKRPHQRRRGPRKH